MPNVIIEAKIDNQAEMRLQVNYMKRIVIECKVDRQRQVLRKVTASYDLSLTLMMMAISISPDKRAVDYDKFMFVQEMKQQTESCQQTPAMINLQPEGFTFSVQCVLAARRELCTGFRLVQDTYRLPDIMGLLYNAGLLHKKKVKPLCLTNYALCREDVWGSGCIDPHILDLETSLR
jgi:hypothetical protein